jgi:transposase
VSKRIPTPSFRGPSGELPIREDDDAAVDLAMLIEGETGGRSLDEVLAKYGRCRSSYYEKLRLYREAGIAGLLPRSPGPRAPWRRNREVIRLIVTERLRKPDSSAQIIAATLRARGFDLSVRSVERTLQEFGLTRGPSRAE